MNGDVSGPRLPRCPTWHTFSPFSAAVPRGHSTFACPVIQQVSTPTNPPMLLPCQHVLSQSAVNSLMKAGGRLKCPYCPTDCQRDQCLVLHLYNTAAPSPPVAS